jgi:hypothetical protein
MAEHCKVRALGLNLGKTAAEPRCQHCMCSRLKAHSSDHEPGRVLSVSTTSAPLLFATFLLQAAGSGSASSTPRCDSRSESPCFVPVEELAGHVSCGLCSGPVASSLLLSCSHLFCGDCVFRHLSQEKPCCPTCNMDLRAVPVRCLAMDKVAASIVPSLTAEQQQQYAKRKQDGQCAADKVCLQPPGPFQHVKGLSPAAGARHCNSNFSNSSSLRPRTPHTTVKSPQQRAQCSSILSRSRLCVSNDTCRIMCCR